VTRAFSETVYARMSAYYTRYYRDVLRIPGWRALVQSRLDEEAQEGAHLSRVQEALGRPVAGLRLLNLGCGTGGFGVVARRAGARVIELDAEWEAVVISEAKSRHEGGSGTLLAAAEELPFRSGSFDLVHCFSTIEHVQGVEAAVREMVRVLAPGGAIYVHTPNRLACYESHYKLFWPPLMPRALARGYLRLRGRPTAFLDSLRLLTPGRLERLFRAAGARVTRMSSSGLVLRETASPLWPLVRAYYRLFGVDPYIELMVRA
jgi:2-polyprenyl-3-methyl-5-hydroxy-6-metoxy-1,4-benzoquinol methylase